MRLKTYRGMGSLEAMQRRSGERYFAESQSIKVAQGVAGAVIDKGSVKSLIPYTMTGVRLGIANAGFKSIDELHAGTMSGDLRFEVRTGSSMKHAGNSSGLAHGLRVVSESSKEPLFSAAR